MMVLSQKSKENIKKSVGLDTDKLSSMSFNQIGNYLEDKKGKKFPDIVPNDPRLTGRGSIYFYLKRILRIKQVDKKLAKV